MFLCCFNVIRSQSFTQTMHERDSWLTFFQRRDGSTVSCNLLIQLVLKKSAVSQGSIYSLEYLTGEDSKRHTAEA